MSKKRKIDETDLRILKRLQLDARVSNVKLAEDVHLSPSACLDRTRSLEADGVIARYVTEFDLSKIASSVTLLVEVVLKNHREADLKNFWWRSSNGRKCSNVSRSAAGSIIFFTSSAATSPITMNSRTL